LIVGWHGQKSLRTATDVVVMMMTMIKHHQIKYVIWYTKINFQIYKNNRLNNIMLMIFITFYLILYELYLNTYITKDQQIFMKQKIDLISEKELKPNTEIQLSGVDILGINTNIVIRNVDNQVVVYSYNDIPKPPNPDGTSGDPNSKENIVPHGSMFKIVHPAALNAIYEVYKSAGEPPPTDVVDLQNAQKIRELQNSLEDNQEIEFGYGTSSPPIQVVVRKNGIYVSDYTGSSTSTRTPEKVSVPPHGDMFQVQRDQNLAPLYAAYTGLRRPPSPREFEAETLE
jgi:hypothetical protein